MNSENSKTAKRHVLILNLTDKIHLRRSEKSVALSNLSIYYTWRNIESSLVHELIPFFSSLQGTKHNMNS